jgi:tetraacyldisaccharide 4'-kinase
MKRSMASSSLPAAPPGHGGLAGRVSRAWLRRGPLACLLWPVSLLFGALAGLRRACFRAGVKRSVRLPVPVIVVGNIFIGGTGKTPFTIWLVDVLRQAGYVPGVISRGYGADNALPRAVTPDSLPRDVGDEPTLIARRAACPVVVGRDRVAAGRALLAAHPGVNLIISDDGLQHYALARNMEIILHDSRGIGNGWLLPAGPLREPASRRRDFTVVNGLPAQASLPAGLPASAVRMTLTGGIAERLAAPHERRPLASLQAVPAGRAGVPRLVAAAGIGNPRRFFDSLREAGLDFNELPLPDHFDFAGNPFAGLEDDIILITEKDAVKCRQNVELKSDPRIWVVPVTASVEGGLAQKIVEKCRGYPPA